MKVINNGNTYKISDDTLKTYDNLPAQTYIVRFSKMVGFFLDKYQDMEIKESKIYGVHETKVNKVFNAFAQIDKNLGVILSGNKGIGKSLCAKLIAQKAVTSDLPVIIVDQYIPGIASYIEEIEQPVMVMFDEFDKTFGGIKPEDGTADPQTEMLSLFDGISHGKKLFVITCNSINKLNEFLVNRPGRFHYHFRFEYPTQEEVTEYLKDKLKEEFYTQIPAVVKFSKRVNLNYDCLRAIAFELSQGLTFEEAIKDLNILNTDKEKYNLTMYLNNGEVSRSAQYLDMFDPNDKCWGNIYLHKLNAYFNYSFYIKDVRFDPVKHVDVAYKDAIVFEADSDDITEDNKEAVEALKIEYITIERDTPKGLHYVV